MKESGYPARVVYHDDPRGPHFDLFIRTRDDSLLVTYELSGAEAPPDGFRLRLCPPGAEAEYWARRKQDHRPKYWTYVGPIPGRGRIESRSMGWLDCSILQDVLHLRS